MFGGSSLQNGVHCQNFVTNRVSLALCAKGRLAAQCQGKSTTHIIQLTEAEEGGLGAETIITESDKDDGYFLNCPKTAELYTEDLKFY